MFKRFVICNHFRLSLELCGKLFLKHKILSNFESSDKNEIYFSDFPKHLNFSKSESFIFDRNRELH